MHTSSLPLSTGVHTPSTVGSSTASSLVARGCAELTLHPDKVREQRARHGISRALMGSPRPRGPLVSIRDHYGLLLQVSAAPEEILQSMRKFSDDFAGTIAGAAG